MMGRDVAVSQLVEASRLRWSREKRGTPSTRYWNATWPTSHPATRPTRPTVVTRSRLL